MDFWSRLIGGTYAPKRTPVAPANDPQARLARFKRVYGSIQQICNRPRNLSTEGPLLEQLYAYLERLAILIREEVRAPIPHLCLQYASSTQLYAFVARAAKVSQYEPVVQATISVFAALVDSEEEDFLSQPIFGKSLMDLVTRVVDGGAVLLGIESETAILELLFTIAAKIRLQPEILPVWFTSKAKPEPEDVFVQEKQKFVGITQKEDFPLCYLLIDRVHHEGRIGDFARTGLLYIFEATGRSPNLEEWVVSSDLPTLMASGLGALYSQLSRELSVLHPDATLPPVLAMSDYSTTHARATAESAFSERHLSHMVTFLSYLTFWQDVLDHCKSVDVKQTLLDHFQILFLQQLLYPSLLQSSDTDGGSSVAVLTYISTVLDSLDHQELLKMILSYLLAIPDKPETAISEEPSGATRPSMPARSPTAMKRRQSLMLLAAHKDPQDIMEPTLFNLVDLVLNSVGSRNSQTVFVGLKLVSTLLAPQQRKHALGTLVKTEHVPDERPNRTAGALDMELEQYADLVAAFGRHRGDEDAYDALCQDIRQSIEAQIPVEPSNTLRHPMPGQYLLQPHDSLTESLRATLSTFWSNSIDVNLALTQAMISIALCLELRLDSWLTLDPASYAYDDVDNNRPERSWHAHLEDEEATAWSAAQGALKRPVWPDIGRQPAIFTTLSSLVKEYHTVRNAVSNFDHMIAARKTMLQAASIDAPSDDLASEENSPQADRHLQSAQGSKSRASDSRSLSQQHVTNQVSSPAPGSPHPNATTQHQASTRSDSTIGATSRNPSTSTKAAVPPLSQIFQPPPPETPSTTDVLMEQFEFASAASHDEQNEAESGKRTASLNHVLTNAIVLQEFIMELMAVLQVRAAVLGEREVRVA
ncbi:hypothetical protein MBLNU230_g7914t1 [Neophaeotheca triangularis]